MKRITSGMTCALLLSTIACSGREPTSNQPTVASITLTGAPTAALLPGETAQLQATVIGSDGAPMSGHTIAWRVGSFARFSR